MTDGVEREKIIDSWHQRADAYDILIQRYEIFTKLAQSLIDVVRQYRNDEDKNVRLIDLAAGTGLVSKLLIKNLHFPPESLFLIEPAERMCLHARKTLPHSHVFQINAENSLSIDELRGNRFDFILCNASMHLMSEEEIYPVVSQLLKPTTGYFVYTLWYHAFDETEHFNNDEEFESYVNEALMSFNYPKYFPERTKEKPSNRSRKSLEHLAEKFDLELRSCSIHHERIPMEFDLDFALMKSNWLVDHLEYYRWTQAESTDVNKSLVVDKIRQLIKEKFVEIAFVTVVLRRKES